LLKRKDVSLWTNCQSLIHSFSSVFEELWKNSTDIQNKINEISNFKPVVKEISTNETKPTIQKFYQLLSSVKKEIIMMVSPENLINLWENKNISKNWFNPDISIQIMTPILSKNFEVIKQLTKHFEVKHVPKSYLETIIIDQSHLFQFKTSYSIRKDSKITSDFSQPYYTNEINKIKRMRKTLNQIWKNAQPPSSITLESIFEPYGFMPPPYSYNPWKKMSKKFTVIEEKTCSITEKDVVSKIINAPQSTEMDPERKVFKLYASGGVAIIHPPDKFNLPDMMFAINHIEKQSTFGSGDALLIYLWLKKAEDYSFVLSGGIGDNPRGVKHRKENKFDFAGSAAKQYHRLVKKDELQIRVYGNTVFVGWTVPIKLFPENYIIPPACIFLEGYGKVKTRAFTIIDPTGLKCKVEQNYFDAFVTFLHPKSKYTGPGTDGIFTRDLIATTIPAQN
jgi:hypothetical protein